MSSEIVDSDESQFLSFEESPEEMQKIQLSFYKPKKKDIDNDTDNSENILQPLFEVNDKKASINLH